MHNKHIYFSDGNTTILSLNNYNKSNKEDQSFIQLVNIDKNANFIVNVNDIPIEVTFIIIQVHAYLYNISMSYDNKVVNGVTGNSVTGMNIGLFVETVSSSDVSVYVQNKNNLSVNGLIAVVAYTNNGKSTLILQAIFCSIVKLKWE